MASTNFTTHYSIPLPLGTDLTTPMDYNEAAEAIDTALFGAVTDADNAAEAAGEAVNTANAASEAAGDVGADLALEKAKIVQLQTRMTAAENDIDDVYTDVTDMITAYKDPSATSTHAYAIGDYFIYNETLYKATDAIAIGATIVPNTNCEATNVSTQLIQINSDLGNHHCERVVKTLGSQSSFTVNCGFRPKKVTCYAASEVATISSIGIGSADKSAMCSFTMNDGSHGSSQGNQGVIGELYYDSNNYRVLQIDSITDTSITFNVSGNGFGGDSRTAIWDLYIE